MISVLVTSTHAHTHTRYHPPVSPLSPHSITKLICMLSLNSPAILVGVFIITLLYSLQVYPTINTS
jgi:hypothetical protein